MIRDFIYSDSEKIKSISSQIFQGLTEQFIFSKEESSSSEESQKGPVGSGRLLGDIFSQVNSSTELKFLEDYAYTLLESKLIEDGLVQEFDSDSYGSSVNKNFIKIQATLRINDLAASSRIVSSFNNVGESLWRVINESMTWSEKGNRVLSDSEARKRAGENGMQLNQKVAESAARVIDFGFGDLIEANMFSKEVLFSAPLKRDFLRDNENMILHKYSRVSQRNFVMLGIVTQKGGVPDSEHDIPDVKDSDGIRAAMRTLMLHLRAMERTFSAPAENEVVLDPVAIYSVL